MATRNEINGTPLSALIDTRLEARGLSEADFLHRMGYKNLQKGKERLRAFREARGLKGVQHHEKQIAEALGVELEVVKTAIEETWAIVWRKADEAYAAWFFPHALLKTERTVPSQITFYGMTGGDRRWRLRRFEEGSSPVTFADQVMQYLPDKVMFLGKVLGFYVNYAPDHCVEFDRKGNPVAEYDNAKRMGVSSVGGLEKLFS